LAKAKGGRADARGAGRGARRSEFHAQLLQDALEIVVARVGDDDFTLLSRVKESNARAEMGGKLFLDARNGGEVSGTSFAPG
jgi:hypothetical protein